MRYGELCWYYRRCATHQGNYNRVENNITLHAQGAMPAYCYGTASGPTFFAKEDHNSVPIDGPTIIPNYNSERHIWSFEDASFEKIELSGLAMSFYIKQRSCIFRQ